ncbi:Clp protease N-terminal domain-containing protein [Streptomyces sp. SP17BM10]|uniref:Clp protease N-terminal domain-containing protein n=1 Tax=Streptomyces sp. SP17BM10 TaxID=3002530 RepID=UPI002E79F6B7|nr:Clp protease N-terminal domain-containing protein [Streptomyces sp. SP17BM10]MEE1788546.1 Clp protease N-terminal domain-containing protein [Streptomyces sp. SP17BM10]
METTLEPDRRALDVLDAARQVSGGRLGTEHLLAAVAATGGAAARALTAAGAPAPALHAALRERRPQWTADDGGLADAARRISTAADRALATAMDHARDDHAPRFTAEHVLRAVLADPGNRAVELLARCGVAPAAVLAHLDAPAARDGLHPLLRPTRDALLAHRADRQPRWKRMLTRQAAAGAALAAVRRETDAQADRLGRRSPGTEHVLLAVLALHEVARHQRESREGDVEDDEGSALAARLGLDHARARAALADGRVPLPADPRSVEAYLAGAHDTDGLLRTLLREDTRARRLAETLGADPTGLPGLLEQ